MLNDSKFKTYLMIDQNQLRDITGNTTWVNTAQIASNAGVYGGDCLYFDNSQTTTENGYIEYVVDSQLYTANTLTSGLIDMTKPTWTMSYWFKLTDLSMLSNTNHGMTFTESETANSPIITTSQFSLALVKRKINNVLTITNNVFDGNIGGFGYLGIGIYAGNVIPGANIAIPNTNTWVHVAFVQNNNKLDGYFNGTKFNIISDVSQFISDNNIDLQNVSPIQSIGILHSNISTLDRQAGWFKTYFDEFIFVEDALWTDTFTPPQDYIYKSL